MLAQHLDDGQYQVGRGCAFRYLAGEFEADHLRDQHRHRLTEHGRFRFDTAHAPAEHAQAVDHGGVRIGADQRIRIGLQHAVVLLREHCACEVFEIDLMHDAGIGRHHFEIREGLLAPFQERITFLVALVFQRGIQIHRVLLAEGVDLHRVIDDQFRRLQRVDLVRIATERLHGITHRGEIDHGGYAGEILHQHARGTEGDFAAAGHIGIFLRIPRR